MFVKATHKILCIWLAASPSPVYNETECCEFSASRLEYWKPKWGTEKRMGQENPAWHQLGLVPFPQEQLARRALERGADWILSTFVVPGGYLGELMWPWGISTPQLSPALHSASNPWPSQATSRLSPQLWYQPLRVGIPKLMRGLRPKGPDPNMVRADHDHHLGS